MLNTKKEESKLLSGGLSSRVTNGNELTAVF
jgi:hypothetical protein